eukprot:CAMPEP_0178968612 /NCGR_PEP_ID=MMETSP0789-20121207/18367_1 /TAXON_ID=3005 /ORGANISM="Rhizosolenia setigera, Strain CCMP 1694" /LENGTH=376 /DNA_ID=CAMNT_0020654593 /DNA_START=124 /DNA_END=1254 /DNA_ORIENTATION=+
MDENSNKSSSPHSRDTVVDARKKRKRDKNEDQEEEEKRLSLSPSNNGGTLTERRRTSNTFSLLQSITHGRRRSVNTDTENTTLESDAPLSPSVIDRGSPHVNVPVSADNARSAQPVYDEMLPGQPVPLNAIVGVSVEPSYYAAAPNPYPYHTSAPPQLAYSVPYGYSYAAPSYAYYPYSYSYPYPYSYQTVTEQYLYQPAAYYEPHPYRTVSPPPSRLSGTVRSRRSKATVNDKKKKKIEQTDNNTDSLGPSVSSKSVDSESTPPTTNTSTKDDASKKKDANATWDQYFNKSLELHKKDPEGWLSQSSSSSNNSEKEGLGMQDKNFRIWLHDQQVQYRLFKNEKLKSSSNLTPVQFEKLQERLGFCDDDPLVEIET